MMMIIHHTESYSLEKPLESVGIMEKTDRQIQIIVLYKFGITCFSIQKQSSDAS